MPAPNAPVITAPVAASTHPEGFVEVTWNPSVRSGYIKRTSQGLILKRRYDDADFPFATSEWSAMADFTASVDVNGKLRFDRTGSTSAGWVSSYNYLVPRGAKRFVQAVFQTPSNSMGNWHGLVAHRAEGTTNTFVTTICSAGRVAGERHGLECQIAGVTTETISVGVAAKASVSHRLGLSVDGGTWRARDFLGASTLNDSDSGDDLSGPDRVGLSVERAATLWMLVEEFYVMTGDKVVVTGLPAGAKAQIRDAGGAMLAEAVEAGGTATIDCLLVAFPDPVRVAVVASGGGDLATWDPPLGVWAGDSYQYVP